LLEGVGKEAAERAMSLVPRSPAGSPDTAGLPTGSQEASEEIDDQGIARSEGGPPGTRTRNLRIKSERADGPSPVYLRLCPPNRALRLPILPCWTAVRCQRRCQPRRCCDLAGGRPGDASTTADGCHGSGRLRCSEHG
jgi:hypothetical protein